MYRLYGRSLHQTYRYFKLYHSDVRLLKCVVCSSFQFPVKQYLKPSTSGLPTLVRHPMVTSPTLITNLIAPQCRKYVPHCHLHTFLVCQHDTIEANLALICFWFSYHYLVTNYFNPLSLKIGSWYVLLVVYWLTMRSTHTQVYSSALPWLLRKSLLTSAHSFNSPRL